jgi:hypothetical protein
MGGLFQAENQQLNQLMPNAVAPAQAGAIGSGNFGSLRGQTAVEKAKGDAFSTLMAQQMQAALSNQQTGQQAATNLGNVGQQGINAGMNVGLQQMNAPFQTIGNEASLLGTLQAPTTVSSQKQMSPLTQAATLANTLQGTGVSGGLGTLLFGSSASGSTPATSGLLGGLSNSIYNSLFGSSTPTYGSSNQTSSVPAGAPLPYNPDTTQIPTIAPGSITTPDLSSGGSQYNTDNMTA